MKLRMTLSVLLLLGVCAQVGFSKRQSRAETPAHDLRELYGVADSPTTLIADTNVNPCHNTTVYGCVQAALREAQGGRFGRARDTFATALRYSPEDATVWYNLGILYQHAEDANHTALSQMCFANTKALSPQYARLQEVKDAARMVSKSGKLSKLFKLLDAHSLAGAVFFTEGLRHSQDGDPLLSGQFLAHALWRLPTLPAVWTALATHYHAVGVARMRDRCILLGADARPTGGIQGLMAWLLPSNTSKLSQSIVADALKKRGQLTAVLECDVLDQPDSAALRRLVDSQRPAVIKGVTTKWKAFKSWSRSHLQSKHGALSFDVSVSPDGTFEPVEDRQLWSEVLGKGETPHEITPDEVIADFPSLVMARPMLKEKVSLKKFLSAQGRGKGTEYIQYNEAGSALMRDVVNPLPSAVLDGSKAWISAKPTRAWLHFDAFDNFLGQIRGSKNFTLFAPEESLFVYESHLREVALSEGKGGVFKREIPLKDQVARNNVHSPVDVLSLSAGGDGGFSLARHALPIHCNVEEGDMIFVPAFYWHHVQSKPPQPAKHDKKDKPLNIAVNFWYRPQVSKVAPCPTCIPVG